MNPGGILVSPLARAATAELERGRWRVEVAAAETTTHEVSVPEGYPERLGVGDVAVEKLLEESFRFLLEREPNTSILRSFSLPVIGRYFPEYEREIARRLGAFPDLAGS